MLGTGAIGAAVSLLWLPGPWRLRHVLDGHANETVAIVFSPDASLLATGGSDGLVLVHDMASRRRVYAYDGGSRLDDLVFSPDGRRVAAVGADVVTVHDVVDARLVCSLPTLARAAPEPGQILARFTPDGDRVVVFHFGRGSRGGPAVYDAATGARIEGWRFASTSAPGIVSPYGRRFVAGEPLEPGAEKLHDARTGRAIASLGTSSRVRRDAYAFSPDGSLVACYVRPDGILRLREAKTGNLRHRVHLDTPVQPHRETIAITNDGTRAIVGWSLGITVHEVPSGRLTSTIEGVVGRAAAISSDGRFIAAESSRSRPPTAPRTIDVHVRARPDEPLGILQEPVVWVGLLLGAALVASVASDRRASRTPSSPNESKADSGPDSTA